MGESRWKQIVFAGVCLAAVVIVVIVYLHHSSSRAKGLCGDPDVLMYIDKDTGNGTCYPKGKEGPCGDKSVIVTNRNNVSLGICDCDFSNHERILIFHEETNQCYFIFTQGYCERGQWIAVRSKPDAEGNTAYCETNYCFKPDSPSEWVPKRHEGQECVELGSSEDCPSGEKMRFFEGKVYPACHYTRKPFKQSAASLGPPAVKCDPGYVSTPFGRCVQQHYDFDF